MARNHKAGGQGEPHAARMGELLPSRHRQQGVSGTRQLHSDAVAPVVAVQAQNQASQGRDLSTLASLRALWARTPEPAWARRAVGEGVKFCPRAGCGRSAYQPPPHPVRADIREVLAVYSRCALVGAGDARAGPIHSRTSTGTSGSYAYAYAGLGTTCR